MRKTKPIIISAEDLSLIDFDKVQTSRANLNKLKETLDVFLFQQWTILEEVSLNGSINKDEPIVSIDPRTGEYRVGRYIGSVKLSEQFILKITPREQGFFEGILAAVSEIKFIRSPSEVSEHGFYNWLLIRIIFYGRLKKAFSKCLPFIRKTYSVKGKHLTGKLNINKTVRTLAKKQLVSDQSKKIISPPISSLIVRASGILELKVPDVYNKKRLSSNFELSSDFRGQLSIFKRAIKGTSIKERNEPLKYNSLSVVYKPVTNLAEKIIDLQMSNSNGDIDGLTVLFDVAELWEQFCFIFLQKKFEGCEVIDCSDKVVGSVDIDGLFKIKPDFLILKSGKLVAIADAKYKFTYGLGRENGTTREDLYQMVTYLNCSLGYEWNNLSSNKLLLLYPSFTNIETSLNRENSILKTTKHGHEIQRCLINTDMQDILSIA